MPVTDLALSILSFVVGFALGTLGSWLVEAYTLSTLLFVVGFALAYVLSQCARSLWAIHQDLVHLGRLRADRERHCSLVD